MCKMDMIDGQVSQEPESRARKTRLGATGSKILGCCSIHLPVAVRCLNAS